MVQVLKFQEASKSPFEVCGGSLWSLRSSASESNACGTGSVTALGGNHPRNLADDWKKKKKKKKWLNTVGSRSGSPPLPHC